MKQNSKPIFGIFGFFSSGPWIIRYSAKKKTFGVTFDQNGQNAVSAEFGILAASLPNWRFRTDKDVI